MRRLLALTLLATACTSGQSAPDGSPVASHLSDPAALESGRRLFLGACAGYCHGVRRGGGGDAPDLFDCEWLYGDSDEQLYRTITAGVAGTQMEGFADRMSDADVWRVIAYLRSQQSCQTVRP